MQLDYLHNPPHCGHIRGTIAISRKNTTAENFNGVSLDKK